MKRRHNFYLCFEKVCGAIYISLHFEIPDINLTFRKSSSKLVCQTLIHRHCNFGNNSTKSTAALAIENKYNK